MVVSELWDGEHGGLREVQEQEVQGHETNGKGTIAAWFLELLLAVVVLIVVIYVGALTLSATKKAWGVGQMVDMNVSNQGLQSVESISNIEPLVLLVFIGVFLVIGYSVLERVKTLKQLGHYFVHGLWLWLFVAGGFLLKLVWEWFSTPSSTGEYVSLTWLLYTVGGVVVTIIAGLVLERVGFEKWLEKKIR